MQSLTRQRVAIAAGVRTFVREPTNVALLLVLPPLVVFAFDLAIEPIGELPQIDVPPGGAPLGGALFATAFLAGLLGIFQVVGAAEADRRLVVSGYRPVEVLLARLLTIVLAGTFVAVLTFVTFWLRIDTTPEAPGLAIGALVLAALIYGLLGVIIGAVVGRELEASLVLVFLADFDSFAAIGVIPMEGDWLSYLPLARPSTVLEEAVHAGTLATGDVVGSLLTIAILAALALLVVALRGGSR